MSGAPDRDRGSLKVIVRKLDSLLPELQVGTVNALKIDVEGAELQVLKGAAETIAANPQIVLFLDIHPFLGVNPSEVFDYPGFLGLTVCEMRQPYHLPATPHEGTLILWPGDSEHLTTVSCRNQITRIDPGSRECCAPVKANFA